MTLKAISQTLSDIEIKQHPHMKEMSIGELVAQHMNDEKKMAKMFSKGQQRSLPTIIKVSPEKEMEYYEDITSKSGGELEKLQRVEDDAKELKELVAKKEEESASPEPNEMRKEVVETFLEMTLWGEMHEELKMRKWTPCSRWMSTYIERC